MKKVFKFTETRSWYFELDVDDGAQVEEALAALVGTEGFNYGLTEPIIFRGRSCISSYIKLYYIQRGGMKSVLQIERRYPYGYISQR